MRTTAEIIANAEAAGEARGIPGSAFALGHVACELEFAERDLDRARKQLSEANTELAILRRKVRELEREEAAL